jgi:hypothetical protein
MPSRQDRFFPSWLEPRHGLHGHLRQNNRGAGGDPGRRQQHLRIGGAQDLPRHEWAGQVFLQRPPDPAFFPCIDLDAVYLHGQLGRNLQVVPGAIVVGISTLRRSPDR